MSQVYILNGQEVNGYWVWLVSFGLQFGRHGTKITISPIWPGVVAPRGGSDGRPCVWGQIYRCGRARLDRWDCPCPAWCVSHSAIGPVPWVSPGTGRASLFYHRV